MKAQNKFVVFTMNQVLLICYVIPSEVGIIFSIIEKIEAQKYLSNLPKVPLLVKWQNGDLNQGFLT